MALVSLCAVCVLSDSLRVRQSEGNNHFRSCSLAILNIFRVSERSDAGTKEGAGRCTAQRGRRGLESFECFAGSDLLSAQDTPRAARVRWQRIRRQSATMAPSPSDSEPNTSTPRSWSTAIYMQPTTAPEHALLVAIHRPPLLDRPTLRGLRVHCGPAPANETSAVPRTEQKGDGPLEAQRVSCPARQNRGPDQGCVSFPEATAGRKW